MLSASVSNIDLYRTWRATEELDLGWLLARIRGKDQTEQMRVGEAFHKALETMDEGEAQTVAADGYEFAIQCDINLILGKHREFKVQKQYGNLLVRGRVDDIWGNLVADHKTTAQFDPDRLMEGYQWRFYLDMLDAASFRWNVFVLRELDAEKAYAVTDFHQLEQRRYPELSRDCAKLAREFEQFAAQNLMEKSA